MRGCGRYDHREDSMPVTARQSERVSRSCQTSRTYERNQMKHRITEKCADGQSREQSENVLERDFVEKRKG